jgi:hypothetical protein
MVEKPIAVSMIAPVVVAAILKQMDFKGQTAVISVIPILVGMIFLVPVITEKALAVIAAEASTKPCCFAEFTLIKADMTRGKFSTHPSQSGNTVTWRTAGTTAISFVGDEIGFVKYDVVGYGPVTFSIDNPISGTNHCAVNTEAPAPRGDCSITQGNLATATFNVYKK